MNYLKDNRRAWELQEDGTWIQCLPDVDKPIYIAQQYLLNHTF